MKGRFHLSSFVEMEGVPSEISDLVQKDPKEAFIAQQVSAGGIAELPDDVAFMQVFVGSAHLHMVKDEDIGISVRFWEIVGYVKPPSGRIGRIVCRTRCREGDSPSVIESEFGEVVGQHIKEIFEGTA